MHCLVFCLVPMLSKLHSINAKANSYVLLCHGNKDSDFPTLSHLLNFESLCLRSEVRLHGEADSQAGLTDIRRPRHILRHTKMIASLQKKKEKDCELGVLS